MPKIKEHKYYNIKLVWRDKNLGLFFGLYYDDEKQDRREDLLEVSSIEPSPVYIVNTMAKLKAKYLKINP